MGFSKAYFIPQNETRTYADGSTATGLTDDFKKYQLLRMGALFGYYFEQHGDKIMMCNNSQPPIFLDGNKLPDFLFIDYLQKLKRGYNSLHTNGLKKVLDEAQKASMEDPNSPVARDIAKKLKSKKYIPVELTEKTTVEESYIEQDPLAYLDYLLQDLETFGEVKKADRYKDMINQQMQKVVESVGNTSWGKTISKSLESFWNNNNYVLDSNRSDAVQRG